MAREFPDAAFPQRKPWQSLEVGRCSVARLNLCSRSYFSLRDANLGGLKVTPFASITWSRFDGSIALPRKTLSLRPELPNWLAPRNNRKLCRAMPAVKK